MTIVRFEMLGAGAYAIGDRIEEPVCGTIVSIDVNERGAGGVGLNTVGVLVDGPKKRMRGKSPDEIDDPIPVVTMDREGMKCTWDNIRGLLDELEMWWDEGEDDEVTIRFHLMSEAAYNALPEFMGW